MGRIGPEAQTVVAALRAQLGAGEGPDAAALAACDWAEFERIVRHHALTPIVYKAMERYGELVPPDLLRRMQLAYHGNALRNEGVRRLVGEITTGLASAGIPLVLLKGTALVRTVYDDPGLRYLGDIDLLVDEADVPRAQSRLEREGFLLAEPPKTQWPTCDFHMLYHRQDVHSVPVELHWRLFEDFQSYVFDLRDVRAHAIGIPDLADGVCTMAPEHELAYLCLHLERHAVVYAALVDREDWLEMLLLPQGKGRLMWLYDIALYLRRREADIDWDRFVGDTRRWLMAGRVQVVLELCRRLFSVEPPRGVVSALAGRSPGFTERTAQRALIAAYRAGERMRHGAPRTQRDRWLGVLANRAIGWGHMWRSLFPPAEYLESRYSEQGSTLSLRARHLRRMAPEVWQALRRKIGGVISTGDG